MKQIIFIYLFFGFAVCKRSPPFNGWRLVITDVLDVDAQAHWVAPEEVDKLIDFIDITDFSNATKSTSNREFQYPTQASHISEVVAMYSNYGSHESLVENLGVLSSFHNRHYQTYGTESAAWIRDRANLLIAESGRTDVSANYFEHSWPQPSVIVRFEGRLSSEVIIIGAHQDSINHSSSNKPQARAPGADDNGSGSVCVMEAVGILLRGGFIPERTIEFHWFAAEEVGLLGSQDIAQTYVAEGIPVHAMLNYDMMGYAPDHYMAQVLMQNFVEPALAAFHLLMLETYSDLDIRLTPGHSASDHAAFFRAGLPASCCQENGGYPYIHTDQDLSEHLNFPYMYEFVKSAVGYAVELSYL